MSSRSASVAFGVLLVAAAHCTFDGLDDYSKGSVDAGKDVLDGAPADVSPTCSSCTDAQACVQNKCETCKPTWSLVHPSLTANGHFYEPSTNTLYVEGSRQVGDAAATGYFAFVDSCTGTLEHALDPPVVGDAALGSLGIGPQAGSTLFVGATLPQPPYAGSYARFDLPSQSFQSVLGVPKFSTVAHTDEIWQLAPANGNLWGSGSMQTDTTSANPVVVKTDGLGSACFTPYRTPARPDER
jgi:hypothetical protein